MAKDARPRNQPLLTEDEVAERRHILLAGIEQFNDGYFFEAHETWEDLWYPSPWPMRQFLQGVIQVAAALVHLTRHEYPGTIRLLDAALEKLQQFPKVYLGIDNTRLIEDVHRAREELAALGPEQFEAWDKRGIPAIRVVD